MLTVERNQKNERQRKNKKTVDNDKKCGRLLGQFKKRRFETPSVEPPPVSQEIDNKVKSGKIN